MAKRSGPKRCMTCGETKARDEFLDDSNAKSCRACKEGGRAKWTKAKQAAARYRADRIAVLQRNGEWKRANEVRYKSQQLDYRLAARRARRAEVLEHYGGGCACCGEAEPLFLTIDHIDGNGNAHRREIGKTDMWIWLLRNDYPEGFQILCYNCNAGRYRNGGACPHAMEESDSRRRGDRARAMLG